MIFFGILALGFLFLIAYSPLVISGRISDEEDKQDRGRKG
jgi:hypothetical protein